MIPEAAVEAAAMAIYMVNTHDGSTYELDDYRPDARAALEAAAPHMLAEAWEHDSRACKSEAADDWHDAVSSAYVEGSLSADQANIMWNKNPYRSSK